MRALIVVLLICMASCANAQFRNGRKLELPEPVLCAKRIIHEINNGTNYFYHWRANISEEDWLGARNYCRLRCMDLISLETKEKNDFLKAVIARDDVDEVWTSGRLCDFSGCQRKQFFPRHINGWIWTGAFEQLAPTTDKARTDWSWTGETGDPQPDNWEYTQNRKLESCLAVFNNKYNDGIRWHDAACSRRRSFACEDIRELLIYARFLRPDVDIP
ncbi:hypothetical protein GWI33_020274 [Rhynchophorus ferrugineus]|uniref:C-type lectin domain-containing protein n=1 Tax=Rhynchophorus ferrugineus TaxID=354439 RepID=A0A834M0M5_RHYFE|nr:hypothetical protein GWI33_020274 [Rhynchophorus ferrugineus]